MAFPFLNRPFRRRKFKFVLILCGSSDLPLLNLCLAKLKKNTKQEILVIHNGIDGIEHTNTLTITNPHMSNFRLNREIKTSICKFVDGSFCYLDNDVLAINYVDDIFGFYQEPITFATDHVVTVNHFSKWALKTGNLHEEIFTKFRVRVEPSWSLWNGGVFLGGEESKEFFNLWNHYTHEVLDDPNWFERDQGSLVATVWKLGLQNHRRLPVEYNWIAQHTSLTHGEANFNKIKLMHFIHKGKKSDKNDFYRACQDT